MITEPHIDGIIEEMDEVTRRRAAMMQHCLQRTTGLHVFSSRARMMFVRPVAAFIRPGGLYAHVAVEDGIKLLMKLADNPAPSTDGYSTVGIIAYVYFCVIMMQDNPIYATRLRNFVMRLQNASSNVLTKRAAETALAYLAQRHEHERKHEQSDDAPRAATAHP